MPRKNEIPRLNGVSALITGASSGLGRELAVQFAARGIHGIIMGRDFHRLEETHNLMKDAAGPANWAGATLMWIDLRNIDDFPELLAQRVVPTAELHKIQYLVCNAGIYEGSAVHMVNVNLLSTILLVQAVLPVMERFQRGTIVNINSVAGRNLAPGEAVYAATKHGLAGFFKAVRWDYRERNIRVLDVFPGGIKTPMSAGKVGYENLMEPSEVANTIASVVLTAPESLQIDEISLSKFRFPPRAT